MFFRFIRRNNMATITKIPWCDHTGNFWIGCVEVSAECKNCYARVEAKFYGWAEWGKDTDRYFAKGVWDNVRKWQRDAAKGVLGTLGAGYPHLVFVGSLMDWAEARKDLDPIREKMWEVIRNSPNLHFLMLTKRPENIVNCLPADWGDGYPNVWMGTTIGHMKSWKRAEHLLKIPALVHFISYEPALGPLDDLPLAGFDWIIYGAESGAGGKFRKENKDWARSMRDRCSEEGIAFFHKQSNHLYPDRGIELDGEIIRQFPLHKLPKIRSSWTLG